MSWEEIRPGVRIQGPLWPEPVEVKWVEDRGDYLHLVGQQIRSRRPVEQLLPISVLQVFPCGHRSLLEAGFCEYAACVPTLSVLERENSFGSIG